MSLLCVSLHTLDVTQTMWPFHKYLPHLSIQMIIWQSPVSIFSSFSVLSPSMHNKRVANMSYSSKLSLSRITCMLTSLLASLNYRSLDRPRVSDSLIMIMIVQLTINTKYNTCENCLRRMPSTSLWKLHRNIELRRETAFYHRAVTVVPHTVTKIAIGDCWMPVGYYWVA